MDEASSYFHKMADVQENLLTFLDQSIDWENHIQQFQEYLVKENITVQYLKEFLYLISSISLNHHRSVDFYKKIDQILIFIKEKIKQTFSNSTIFNIFKRNKRILLFLFEEEIIKFDQFILTTMQSLKYNQKNYFNYFLPEITNFKLNQSNKPGKDFEEKRKIGENDNYICSLIRSDSVKDFIIYTNKNNISLTTQIKNSIFETNSFLLQKKDFSLIEYASFFGSIQIFKYLQLNNVELTPSLIMFAIHGKNPDLIHILEENNIKPKFDSSYIYLSECIKCHHNEYYKYYLDNFVQNIKMSNKDCIVAALESYNFFILQNDINYYQYLYYICKYDHTFLCQKLIANQQLDVNVDEILIKLIRE